MHAVCIVAAVALVTTAASAQGARNLDNPAGAFPQVTGELHIELTHARNYRGNDGVNLNHDTFTDAHLNFGVFFLPGLSVQGRVNAEPARALTDNRFLDDTSVFVQELYLQYERPWFTVFGGKFNPAFGIAPESAEKIRKPFGQDFKEDYELTEAIGFGGALRYDSLHVGSHELIGSVWQFDNTLFNNTLIGARPQAGAPDTERIGHARRGDGGAGNNRSLSSYTLTLEGDQIPYLSGFNYHLSYARLGRGVTETRNQHSYAAAGQYEFRPQAVLGGPGWLKPLRIVPLVEHVWINQVGGNSGGVEQNARYFTTAVEVGYGGFWLYGLRTSRKLMEPEEGTGPNGGNGFQDRLAVASAGYDFDFGLTLALGWKRDRTLSLDTDTIGIFGLYHIRF